MVARTALTIAGSDSGGGAGIQADLKAFSALGVYGASVITALTAQNTRGVQGVHAVPPAFVAAQLDSVIADIAIDAVKVGMLANAAIIGAVAERLERYPVSAVVLDPVMVATSGDRLLDAAAVEALRGRLMPLATLVTPNLPEAAALLGLPVAESETAMRDQAEHLIAAGARAVLVKGGHGEGSESVDWLIAEQGSIRLTAPRIRTHNTHGTGCTLSAAIAAELAKGASLAAAVQTAKDYVSAAIAAADRLEITRAARGIAGEETADHAAPSHGPTHHFHAWW